MLFTMTWHKGCFCLAGFLSDDPVVNGTTSTQGRRREE